MSQLLLNAVPGFADLDEATIAAEEVLTDDALVKICQNAKFAAVRPERIYMGFYKNGDTVGLPVSPVDGYTYTQDEILYDWFLYSTRAPAAGFIAGQADPPAISAGQPANLYWLKVDIDDTTGLVDLWVSYYKQGEAETITHDGIVKVYANGQRQSLNIAS